MAECMSNQSGKAQTGRENSLINPPITSLFPYHTRWLAAIYLFFISAVSPRWHQLQDYVGRLGSEPDPTLWHRQATMR